MSFYNDKDILRQIIVSHYDNPIHKIDENTELNGYVKFHNKSASCIDDFTVYIKINNNLVSDAKFSGIGCAISTASTDIFCDLLINKNINDVDNIFNNYKAMINNEQYDESLLGELIAFSEIYKQPNRIKCSLIGCDAFINVFKEK